MFFNKCPVCNRDLNNLTYEGQMKHIRACTRRKNQYIATGNPVGRPSSRRRIKTPKP